MCPFQDVLGESGRARQRKEVREVKICIVAEGCYPYVVGGVSSWIHSMIRNFPNIEFILLAIVADRSQRGIFAYELPENLTEVHEVYLEDRDWQNRENRKNKFKLNKKEYRALRNMVLNEKIDWDIIFDLFYHKKFSIDELLMGPDFFHIARECYKIRYSQIVFSDFLWTLRSIYLPLFFVLKTRIPKADLYHCVSTGYAGILGSMAKHFHHCGLMVSEHGIYTREREEELIKADWVDGIYKNIWIEQFKKMSLAAYDRADLVTSLYEHARGLQIELGCPAEKTRVTPNGIDTGRLEELPGKREGEQDMIQIGAVLRVTPIKDVKTMIQAFSYAKKRVPALRLFVMGPCDEDEEYAGECFELVETLGVSDVVFTGRVDVREYLGRMDMTILTSISEGQPLTILESFAAHKPVIATDVGNCRELIYGEEDEFGTAGILTHIMNLEEITDAMVELANNQERREQMGKNGYQRVMSKYKIEDMRKTYHEIYYEFCGRSGGTWSEEAFSVTR